MSGNFEPERVRLAALVGVVQLAKPIELHELHETVVRLLTAAK